MRGLPIYARVVGECSQLVRCRRVLSTRSGRVQWRTTCALKRAGNGRPHLASSGGRCICRQVSIIGDGRWRGAQYAVCSQPDHRSTGDEKTPLRIFDSPAEVPPRSVARITGSECPSPAFCLLRRLRALIMYVFCITKALSTSLAFYGVGRFASFLLALKDAKQRATM